MNEYITVVKTATSALSKLPLGLILGRTYGMGALAETCAKLKKKKQNKTNTQVRRQLYKVTDL